MPSITELADNGSHYVPDALNSVFRPVYPLAARIRESVYTALPDFRRETPWGIPIVVDHANYVERTLADGRFETDMADYFIDHLSEVTYVADIGANIGFYSLLASVHGDCKVDAFEPLPRNTVRLQQNVELNDSSSVSLHTYAVGDDMGTIELYVSDEYPGETSISRQLMSTSSDRSVVCATRRLDDIYDNSYPDCLKIDVEGAEIAVFRGARDVLSAQPEIYLELHPPIINRLEEPLSDLVEILTEAGYTQVYHIQRDAEVPLSSLESYEENHTHLHITT